MLLINGHKFRGLMDYKTWRYLNSVLKDASIIRDQKKLVRLCRELTWRRAENDVADLLYNRGYEVIQDIDLFHMDKDKKCEAQIDVLAIANDHIIICEVKHWEGDWLCNDKYWITKAIDSEEDEFSKLLPNRSLERLPRWKNLETDKMEKSPVFQLVRARDIFVNIFENELALASIVKEKQIRGLVVWTRGKIDNFRPSCKYWEKLQLQVRGYKDARGAIGLEKLDWSPEEIDPDYSLIYAVLEHSNDVKRAKLNNQ